MVRDQITFSSLILEPDRFQFETYAGLFLKPLGLNLKPEMAFLFNISGLILKHLY